MDLATIICEYIYGAFTVVKASIDALVSFFETTIEKLFTTANAINQLIFSTLSKGLDAILLVITNALNALVNAMNFSIDGSWRFCSAAFKCNFFLEQILDPDSLIAKTIRKILAGKNDCFCKDDLYNFQSVLYDIATDYENFKTQICNGLSLDMANDMATDLCLGYLSKLNKWKKQITAKLFTLKKYLQGLLDDFRNSKLFDLLDELQAFFECVIDSELCANVDTARSYFNYILKKLNLVEAGTNNYQFSKSFEDELLGTCNSFLARVNAAIRQLNSTMHMMSCSASFKGAKNALDLTSTIKGVIHVAGDYMTGQDAHWNRIPIINYAEKTYEELYDAFLRLHQKNTTDSELAMKSNKCFTMEDVLLETVADGEAEDYLLVEDGADTSHAQELIQVDDKLYTVADAARQLYTGEGDQALMNFCKNAGELLNAKDILTRY